MKRLVKLNAVPQFDIVGYDHKKGSMTRWTIDTQDEELKREIETNDLPSDTKHFIINTIGEYWVEQVEAGNAEFIRDNIVDEIMHNFSIPYLTQLDVDYEKLFELCAVTPTQKTFDKGDLQEYQTEKENVSNNSIQAATKQRKTKQELQTQEEEKKTEKQDDLNNYSNKRPDVFEKGKIFKIKTETGYKYIKPEIYPDTQFTSVEEQASVVRDLYRFFETTQGDKYRKIEPNIFLLVKGGIDADEMIDEKQEQKIKDRNANRVINRLRKQG